MIPDRGQSADTDAMWGPSVHWNTYLDSYVMLLNHSCRTSGFPQEGIYMSYNTDLDNPASWSEPSLLLQDTGWYPQYPELTPPQRKFSPRLLQAP